MERSCTSPAAKRKRRLPLTALVLALALLCRPAAATARDVAALSRWARGEGVFVHDNLSQKDYGAGTGDSRSRAASNGAPCC